MNEKHRTKGYVSYAAGRPFRGQMQYSIRLKNEEKWFSCGPADPKIKKNDLVEFDYEESGGYYNVFVDSLRVIDLGAEPSAKPSGQNNTGVSKDVYWDERFTRDLANDKYKRENDLRIQYQAARNAAIAVLDILAREKALIIPEKKGAAGEVIMAKLEDLTNEFFHKTSTIGAGTENETEQEDRKAA